MEAHEVHMSDGSDGKWSFYYFVLELSSLSFLFYALLPNFLNIWKLLFLFSESCSHCSSKRSSTRVIFIYNNFFFFHTEISLHGLANRLGTAVRVCGTSFAFTLVDWSLLIPGVFFVRKCAKALCSSCFLLDELQTSEHILSVFLQFEFDFFCFCSLYSCY